MFGVGEGVEPVSHTAGRHAVVGANPKETSPSRQVSQRTSRSYGTTFRLMIKSQRWVCLAVRSYMHQNYGMNQSEARFVVGDGMIWLDKPADVLMTQKICGHGMVLQWSTESATQHV